LNFDIALVLVSRRTLGVLAAADLDELLDVGDFGRHFGGGGCRVVKVRWISQKRAVCGCQIVVVSKGSLNRAFPFSS